MRPYRANLSLRAAALQRTPLVALGLRARAVSEACFHATRSFTTSGALSKSKPYLLPPVTHFRSKASRWYRYEDPGEEVREIKHRNPLNYIELERQAVRRGQIANRRMVVYGVGIVMCLIAQFLIIMIYDDGGENKALVEKKKQDAEALQASTKEKKSTSVRDIIAGTVGKDRLDAPPGKDVGVFEGKKVVEKLGTVGELVDEDGRELAATGTSSLPFFPKNVYLPGASGIEEEYHLLGLGVRTVSFLGIQVYVLGLYVRAADLPTLQAAFVKRQNPLGTSLIPQEKTQLKADLLDPDQSLEIWDHILRESRVKSAVRIVPTRNTDFGHLRDGFVRGITARTQDASRKGSHEYDDDEFGKAMQDFKALFGGRGKAPKGSIMTLARDENGTLSIMYQGDEKTQKPMEIMGKLVDERIARQVWLGYLGGKNVSSEAARKSVVDGVLDLVERPVGTVGMQVT